jgi:oligosaccharide repeat unit polymerase
MFPVVFNAFLFVALFLVYWINRRQIDCGFILLLLYAIVSVFGIFLYLAEPGVWKLKLWSYLYLFVSLLLFFRPYLGKKKFEINFLNVKNVQVLKRFSTVFIVFSLYFVSYTESRAWDNFNSGDWLTVRANIYDDEFKIYDNAFQWFAYAVILYFHTAAVVVFFYFLTLDGIKKAYMWLFFAAIVLPILSWTFITASRGNLMVFFMLLIACYLVFKDGLSAKLKKWLLVGGVTFVVIVLVYSIQVTVSRFGDGEQSSSLLYYFGHSFMTFNYGVTDSISEYTGGKYFFKRFYDLLGLDGTIDYACLGTHFSNSFITFVGTLYLDWGPLGTILIALILPLIVNLIISKKQVDIAAVYLYIFYLNYLMQGVFVLPNSNSVSWIVTVFIYFALKNKNIKTRFCNG